MNDIHEASPEFVSRLEWQVRTSLSRHDRFSLPASRTTGRLIKLGAVVMISVFVGAAGITANEWVKDAKVRGYFLNRIDVRIQLAEARLALLRDRVETVAQQREEGLVREEALSVARQDLRAAELDYTRLQLDREEIEASGREPLQSLSAPLVDGRDFVTERLALELSLAEDALHLAETRSARERSLVEQGLMTARGTREREETTMLRSHELDILKAQLDVRRQFLDGELSAEQVEREALVSEARFRLDHQNFLVELARERLDRSTELRERGMIHEAEVRSAEDELRQRQLELQELLTSIEHLESAGSVGRQRR